MNLTDKYRHPLDPRDQPRSLTGKAVHLTTPKGPACGSSSSRAYVAWLTHSPHETSCRRCHQTTRWRFEWGRWVQTTDPTWWTTQLTRHAEASRPAKVTDPLRVKLQALLVAEHNSSPRSRAARVDALMGILEAYGDMRFDQGYEAAMEARDEG